MAKNVNPHWEELIRAGLFPFNVAIPMHSILYSNRFLGGPKYKKICLYLENNIAYYYENFDDHRRVGLYCLDLFVKKPKTLTTYLKKWHNEFNTLIFFLEKTRLHDLATLSTKQLGSMLLEVYQKAISWHGIAYNIDAIDVVLTPHFEKIISKNFPDKTQSQKASLQNRLTFPNKQSYVNRFYLDKLLLFQKMGHKGVKKTEKDINQFLDTYYWVNFCWEESNEYTKKMLLAEYEEINVKELKKEIKDTKNTFHNSLSQKKELVLKLKKTNPEITTYLSIFDVYAVLHDLRKEGQVKATDVLRKIYNELSIRLGINSKLLYYFWPQELGEIARDTSQDDISLAQKRQKKWFCEYTKDGTLSEWFGNEARERKNNLIDVKQEYGKELSGVAASSGRVTGTARICLDAKDAIAHIKKGDILVTGMTMPDFVPAMKKAAAIVTDEGGLTCHAAIICRELGIPCIVGTQHATRILTDGDGIEVNANHGVVKILTREAHE